MSTDAITRICHAAAARYARQCWWADPDDLRQEAHLAALHAQRTYQPAVRVPLEAYVWRAVILALKRYLWRESSPVCGGGHDPHRLRTQHRASLDAIDALRVNYEDADEALADAHWRASVREEFERLLATTPKAALARRVVLDGLEPCEAIALEGVDRLRVYDAIWTFREAARRSGRLWRLLRQRREW